VDIQEERNEKKKYDLMEEKGGALSYFAKYVRISSTRVLPPKKKGGAAKINN
jgi:hypothetical protein